MKDEYQYRYGYVDGPKEPMHYEERGGWKYLIAADDKCFGMEKISFESADCNFPDDMVCIIGTVK